MLFRSAFIFLGSFFVLSSSAQLAQVVTNCVNPKQVALTFDDGPYSSTQIIRQMLNLQNIKATFFYNGVNFDCIYNHISDVYQMYSDGHQISSHTWNHFDLATLSWDEIHNQMYLTERAIYRITGAQVAMMRPPFGSYNDQVRQASYLRNQTLIIWNMDSGDAGVPPKTTEQSEALYDAAIASGSPGGILTLNHETHNTTVNDVIPYAIQKLKNAGYDFVTVAECSNLPAYQWQDSSPQPVDPSWQSECV